MTTTAKRGKKKQIRNRTIEAVYVPAEVAVATYEYFGVLQKHAGDPHRESIILDALNIAARVLAIKTKSGKPPPIQTAFLYDGARLRAEFGASGRKARRPGLLA
jgi:hypothetical protein